MNKTSDPRQQLPMAGQRPKEVHDTIVVQDAKGRLRRGVVTFKDPSGRNLTCHVAKSYWARGGKDEMLYYYDCILPEGAAVPELSAQVTLEEPDEDASTQSTLRPFSNVLTHLSEEQKRKFVSTVMRLSEFATGLIQIVAMDTQRGTILIRDAAAVLKTIDIVTGKVLAELQLTENRLFVDKARHDSLGSETAPASSQADETANPKQEVVPMESGSVNHANAVAESFNTSTAKRTPGESTMALLRENPYATPIQPEESEFTRLSRLTPAERKNEEDAFIRQLQYS